MRRIRVHGPCVLVCACVALIMCLGVCMPRALAEEQDVEIATLADLKGKRIGMASGVAFDQLIEENLEGVDDFLYYNSISDLVAALQSGKVDAFIEDDPMVRLAVARNKGIAVLPEQFVEDDYGFVFPKGSGLTAEFNQVLAKLRADGTLDELKAKWTGADEAAKTVPEQDWDTPKGTLTMAIENAAEPMAYVSEGNQTIGYCVDLALLICKECGYGLKVDTMPFTSELAAVQSGKADFGGGNVSITDERKQSLDFSDPSYNGAATFAVRTTGDATAADDAELEIQDAQGIVGKRLGMLVGGNFDALLTQSYEGVEQDDFSYFNSYAELVAALQTNKIDAIISDLPVAQLIVARNDGVGIVSEPLVDDHYGFVLEKGSPLTDQLSERIQALREDGTLDALSDKWMSADDDAKTMPEQDWDAPNGSIKVSAGVDTEPMCYLRGSEPVGLSLELLEYVARDLGYTLSIRGNAPGSVIADVQSGKAQVGAGCFSITDERKQMVDMSESYFDGGVVAIVRSSLAATDADEGFLEGLAASFERTFLKEDRWQMVLGGLGVTVLISVASGALGLALGFLLVLARRRDEDGLANRLISLMEKLLGGLPVVVVLMVFYYIIFGSLNISGIIVAILAFTLMFAATTGSVMYNTIRTIDVGQTEAGRALGFGDSDTFNLIVLPQAARQFAPVLLGQFVSLVKDTSIVGYIAVQDLTRVGDLIRSRTMEAFFPLIAIAIIYFVLCRLLAWLLGLLVRKLEPKEGPRTIKGVEL